MLPARIDAETFRRLDRHAKRLGKPRSNLVERYVAEGLRMDEHPGIVFVEGPAGRRPAVRRGPEVWEDTATLHDTAGDVPETAKVLAITEGDLRLALPTSADRRAT